ncbi:MAG: hypothetical protein ABL891_13040 [Burkholderiales bacterium]
MITLQDYWMGRDTQYAAELTPDIVQNALLLTQRITVLLEHAAAENISPGIDEATCTCVASGWRPKSVNEKTANASATSLHLNGMGIDLREAPGRALARFCLRNLDLLAKLELWMEDPRWTPTWVHLQSRAPGSNDRVFIPSSAPPLVAALPEQMLA